MLTNYTIWAELDVTVKIKNINYVGCVLEFVFVVGQTQIRPGSQELLETLETGVLDLCEL